MKTALGCSICHNPFARTKKGGFWCWTCDGHVTACRFKGESNYRHCRCLIR